MPTNRRRVSRGWAGRVQWSEIGNPFTCWLMEAELYIYLPFNNRQEMLVSYPDWREEYLAATAAELEANKPIKRITEPGQAQDQADFAYRFQLDQWQYERTQTPQIERWYQGFD